MNPSLITVISLDSHCPKSADPPRGCWSSYSMRIQQSVGGPPITQAELQEDLTFRAETTETHIHVTAVEMCQDFSS